MDRIEFEKQITIAMCAIDAKRKSEEEKSTWYVLYRDSKSDAVALAESDESLIKAHEDVGYEKIAKYVKGEGHLIRR